MRDISEYMKAMDAEPIGTILIFSDGSGFHPLIKWHSGAVADWGWHTVQGQLVDNITLGSILRNVDEHGVIYWHCY